MNNEHELTRKFAPSSPTIFFSAVLYAFSHHTHATKSLLLFSLNALFASPLLSAFSSFPLIACVCALFTYSHSNFRREKVLTFTLLLFFPFHHYVKIYLLANANNKFNNVSCCGASEKKFFFRFF